MIHRNKHKAGLTKIKNLNVNNSLHYKTLLRHIEATSISYTQNSAYWVRQIQ